jgi:WD40 repeat protein
LIIMGSEFLGGKKRLILRQFLWYKRCEFGIRRNIILVSKCVRRWFCVLRLASTIIRWYSTLFSILGDCTEFKAHQAAVRSVEFSPENLRLLSASDDKSIKVWTVHR